MALLKDSLVRRADSQRAIVTATPDKPRFRPIAPLNEVLAEITSAITDKMNEHFARLSKIIAYDLRQCNHSYFHGLGRHRFFDINHNISYNTLVLVCFEYITPENCARVHFLSEEKLESAIRATCEHDHKAYSPLVTNGVLNVLLRNFVVPYIKEYINPKMTFTKDDEKFVYSELSGRIPANVNGIGVDTFPIPVSMQDDGTLMAYHHLDTTNGVCTYNGMPFNNTVLTWNGIDHSDKNLLPQEMSEYDSAYGFDKLIHTDFKEVLLGKVGSRIYDDDIPYDELRTILDISSSKDRDLIRLLGGGEPLPNATLKDMRSLLKSVSCIDIGGALPIKPNQTYTRSAILTNSGSFYQLNEAYGKRNIRLSEKCGIDGCSNPCIAIPDTTKYDQPRVRYDESSNSVYLVIAQEAMRIASGVVKKRIVEANKLVWADVNKPIIPPIISSLRKVYDVRDGSFKYSEFSGYVYLSFRLGSIPPSTNRERVDGDALFPDIREEGLRLTRADNLFIHAGVF